MPQLREETIDYSYNDLYQIIMFTCNKPHQQHYMWEWIESF